MSPRPPVTSNNEIGLSATILGTPSDAEILVAEMGTQ